MYSLAIWGRKLMKTYLFQMLRGGDNEPLLLLGGRLETRLDDDLGWLLRRHIER